MEEISNKTKIILIVLSLIPIIIVIFFGGLIIVNAETNYNQSITLNINESSTSVDRVLYNDSANANKAFANAGRGTLVTVILTYKYGTGTSTQLPTLYSVNARTDTGYSSCYVSSLNNNSDDNTDDMKANLYGVSCDLTMGTNGLVSLSANFAPNTSQAFNIRVYNVTFNNNLEAQEVQYEQYVYAYMQNFIYPKLNEIDENTTTSANELQYIYAYLQNYIYTALNSTSTAINNQTTTINNNHDELMDTDIDSTTKENVDTTSINDYEDAESDIMDQVGEADLTSLNIGIDSETSTTIWGLITRIIQSNAKIFGLFISILSIGIIKIALAR